MVTVRSLPRTRAIAIVSDSTITGLTLPGMMLLPGCTAGSAISPMPATGPQPISRMSEPIFQRLVAVVRSTPCADTSESSVAWAQKWSAVSFTGRPVDSARREQARAANSGWALIPVPTAVPPRGTDSSSSSAPASRRREAFTCPA